MSEFGTDPDAIYDDATVFFINIEVFGSGALKVSGHVHDKAYALACIDAAKAAVIRHHEKPQIFIEPPPAFLKPDEVAHAIQIKVRRNGNMSTGGSISNKPLALLILDHARDAVAAQHNEIVDGAGVLIPRHDTEFSDAQLLD